MDKVTNIVTPAVDSLKGRVIDTYIDRYSRMGGTTNDEDVKNADETNKQQILANYFSEKSNQETGKVSSYQQLMDDVSVIECFFLRVLPTSRFALMVLAIKAVCETFKATLDCPEPAKISFCPLLPSEVEFFLCYLEADKTKPFRPKEPNILGIF